MRNKALRPPASLEIEHTSTDVTDANVFELAARAASSFDRIGKRTEKRARFISRHRPAQPCRRRKRFKLAHYLWISHKFKDVKHSAGLCTLATANRHRFKSKKAMLRLILALKWSGICERRAASFFRRKSSRKQEASTPPPIRNRSLLQPERERRFQPYERIRALRQIDSIHHRKQFQQCTST